MCVCVCQVDPAENPIVPVRGELRRANGNVHGQQGRLPALRKNDDVCPRFGGDVAGIINIIMYCCLFTSVGVLFCFALLETVFCSFVFFLLSPFAFVVVFCFVSSFFSV